MNLKIKLTLLVILMLNITLMAQSSFTINGTVLSQTDNSPIPGASIIIKGSTKGASTDFDGNFSLNVASGDVLEVSFLGFTTKLVPIANQKQLTIVLAESTNTLDEIVVVGYGTQRKSHLSGSISKVVNESLDQIATARADDALVGQVSGVNIQATNPEAGEAPTIRIRGVGSINASSNPLLVIDGVPVDIEFFGNLNMNDVESIEVLKDAASSAIYGSQGANGVIMVTTKQGKEGKVKFSLSTFTGFKSVPTNDNYNMSLKEWTAMELAANGKLSYATTFKNLLGIDHNWQDDIYDGGTITSHNLSVRGGTDKTKFSASLGYLHDEGVIITDDYKKYNLKLKLDTKVSDKLSFGANLSPSFTERRRLDGDTYGVLRQGPWLPIYLDEHTIQFVDRAYSNGKYANVQVGDYAMQDMFRNYPITIDGVTKLTSIRYSGDSNPYAQFNEVNYNEDRFSLTGNIYAQYNITDDLSFKTSLGGSYRANRDERYIGVLQHSTGADRASSRFRSTHEISLVNDNLFFYNKEFGKHEINAVVGISAQKENTFRTETTGIGYEFDYIQTLNAATIISNATSYEVDRRMLSFLGRLNYSFDGKYLASLSVRRDGSSVFGPDKKYGNFPAASVGWNAYKEDFLKDSDVVSNLKLRFSYGVTGTDAIDEYKYLALLETSSAVVNGSIVNAFNPSNISNPELQWERSIEWNPGVDFGFFNNRISGSVDYYNRTSDNLLLFLDIPSVTGFSNTDVNLGQVENAGFELEIRTRNISKDKFSWNTSILASRNKNTLLDFGTANGLISSLDTKRASEWINLVGHPISSFYGYVVDKQIPTEYLKDPWAVVGGQAQDVYVKDLNGDGLIDADDKTILGDPYPDIVWSVSNEFNIGNFDFSFMFQGSHGAEIRNMEVQYYYNHFNSGMDYDPAITPDQGFIQEKIFTSDIIQNASFVALRNVNIGYKLPESVLKKLQLSSARIYATGQNLLYFTADNYTGANPEAMHSYNTVTQYGYHLGGAPVSQTISVGLNLEF
ncbi:MAG: TonB-dependent receptor [Lutibacter sp.]|nr:TonB-dependent receptor [Lutibacter sp.]MBI9042102.1 TonB-dependent receptor [Lutibacter sp.]